MSLSYEETPYGGARCREAPGKEADDASANRRNSAVNRQGYGFDTQKIHAAYDPSQHQGALSVPIYQNTSFEFGSVDRASRLVHYEELGNIYTRTGNPTVAVLEQRIAALDGGVAAVALASGMAAVTYTVMNITNIGERIVSSPFIYGGTYDAFKKVLSRVGVSVDYATALTPQAIKTRITEQTRAVFIESIANPLGTVADIAAIANVAHAHGIPLIVDNTQATPYLINPLKLGADIVVYSATKALAGHGNIIAGLIVEGGEFDYASGSWPQFSEEKHFLLRDREGRYRSFVEVFPTSPFIARARALFLAYIGAALGPFDAYLALVGLETLSERVEKQLSNTRRLVNYLSGHKHVEFVNYSELPDSPNHEIAQRVSPKGAGSVFSFGIEGSFDEARAFIDAVGLFKYAANLGDVRSLIVNSPFVTHKELTPEELTSVGQPANLIRLSLGLEDPEDLIADLEQAFRAVYG
jgi:O-acetylhomoserine (thiol)-lyase